MARPLTVTVCGWTVIVVHAIALLVPWLAVLNPAVAQAWAEMNIPLETYATLLTLEAGLMIFAGWAVLEGHNWGRHLLLGLSIATPILRIIIATTTSILPTFRVAPLFLGMAMAQPAFIAVLLYRERSTAWFLGWPDPEPGLDLALWRYRRARQRGDWSRLLSIPAMLAGFVVAVAGTIALTTVVGVARGFGGTGSPGMSLGIYAVAFAVLAGGAVVYGAGIYLWGRKRWRVTLGFGLVAIAAWTISGLAYSQWMLNNPELMRLTLPDVDSAGMERLTDAYGQIVAALKFAAALTGLLGLLGAALVHTRWAQDRSDVREMLAATGTE